MIFFNHECVWIQTNYPNELIFFYCWYLLILLEILFQSDNLRYPTSFGGSFFKKMHYKAILIFIRESRILKHVFNFKINHIINHFLKAREILVKLRKIYK